MENNQVKITTEELEKVSTLRNEILENVESIGRLNIRKHFLIKELEPIEATLISLLQKSEDLDTQEKNVIDEIIQKYGEGQLNFETGIYTKEK